jgi:hypothetical protein
MLDAGGVPGGQRRDAVSDPTRPSDPDEDGYRDQYAYDTFLRRVTSVRDPELRRNQVRRHVVTVDPETVAAHLQRALRDAVRGVPDAGEVVLPLVEFIASASSAQQTALDAVDLAARAMDAHGVAWLLLDPPPARRIDARTLKSMRVESQSLGHRKAHAALQDRRMLERLVYDDHPMVIERLLRNPRVVESHVMAIATRRPTTPELLGVIASSPRWMRVPRVREGLVQNPYASTGMALRLLPTVRASIWESLPFASEPHAALKQFAQYLVALRERDDAEPAPDTLRRRH